MLARRLEPPLATGTWSGRGGEQPRHPARERAEGRWRTRGRRPTKGPAGDVRWWERPAPGGDEALWAAVQRLHERRITSGMSVTELARRLEASGHRIRRETLSRVLNGRQPTRWSTVEALAVLLDANLPHPPALPGASAPDLSGQPGQGPRPE